MESTIQGRVYKFGDNVNSDIIIPGRYLIYIDRERLAQHAFEVLGEGFPAKLREFQILVAGRNFGCGSAREQAATAIQGLGIQAVIACSFARTFYRNGPEIGLPLLEAPGLHDLVETGHRIRVNIEAGVVENLTTGKSIQGRAPSGLLLDMLLAGGLIPLLKSDAGQGLLK